MDPPAASPPPKWLPPSRRHKPGVGRTQHNQVAPDAEHTVLERQPADLAFVGAEEEDLVAAHVLARRHEVLRDEQVLRRSFCALRADPLEASEGFVWAPWRRRPLRESALELVAASPDHLRPEWLCILSPHKAQHEVLVSFASDDTHLSKERRTHLEL